MISTRSDKKNKLNQKHKEVKMKKIGVKFVLDEQKIQNEGEYNVEKM